MAGEYFNNERYRNVQGILKVVEDGLCHKCGACVGVCPVGTFDMDANGYPIQVANCIDCNICVQSCSGIGVDYPAIGERLFGPEYTFGALMGQVDKAYCTYAAEHDIRRIGASGGFVTQLLVHLIESGQFKGALVAIEDPNDPAMGKGIIARTREELIHAAQSKYTTTPSLGSLAEIQDDDGPYAMVGLPCQVHSLRKRQMMDPRWKARIPLTIGLHCHVTIPVFAVREMAQIVNPGGGILEHVRYRRKGPRPEEGWPYNTWEFSYSDGSHWRSPNGPASTFNIAARIGSLGRCHTCCDQTAEFADLAVADPWVRDKDGSWKYPQPDGWSTVLVRTAYGETVMQEAIGAGQLIAEDIAPKEIEAGQRRIMLKKKRNVKLRMKVMRLLGRQVPEYPMPLDGPDPAILLDDVKFWGIHLLTTIRPLRYLAVKAAFSPLGTRIMRSKIKKRAKVARRAHEAARADASTGMTAGESSVPADPQGDGKFPV